jgi:galactose mutarotase-like enzyme
MITTVPFQGQSVFRLTDGNSEILLSPNHGGRLLRWQYAERPVICWPENADWNLINKVRGGNPILFPFIARHYVNGALGKWQDAEGVVRDLPMHGFARDLPFAHVSGDDQNTLTIRLEHNAETLTAFPFPFRFDLKYKLESSSLTVSFITTNLGPTPLPYYPGHHFYFAMPHQDRKNWRISFPSLHSGRQNSDGSIVFSDLISHDHSLADPELSDRFHLDSHSGNVSLQCLTDPRRIEFITSTTDVPDSAPWHAITTWTQTPESDFYCVEPWLGLPNAIHHGHGLRWIAPGTTETATCRLELKGW